MESDSLGSLVLIGASLHCRQGQSPLNPTELSSSKRLIQTQSLVLFIFSFFKICIHKRLPRGEKVPFHGKSARKTLTVQCLPSRCNLLIPYMLEVSNPGLLTQTFAAFSSDMPFSPGSVHLCVLRPECPKVIHFSSHPPTTKPLLLPLLFHFGC